MIVTRRNGGLELVEQVEHGRVAGELAAAWGNADWAAPDPGPPVVLAATRHDEGWRAWDGTVLFHDLERRPLHFLEIDLEEHISLYRGGVQQVSLLDVYAGLLVGMHWSGLYRGRWSRPGAGSRLQRSEQDARRQDAVIEEEERRWILARRRAWTVDEPRSVFETRLWQHYDLLQLWDLLSLYLCVMPDEDPAREPADQPCTEAPRTWGPQLRDLEHHPEAVLLPPVAVTPGGKRCAITAAVTSPGVVTLDPFPFAASVRVEVASRILPDRRWTHDEVVARLARTPATARTWRLEPGGVR
ncbi:MAG: DUF3891 family protein [Actinomycetota bacterium]|nr:DUF3891 family protein [Actinomycetota bacterium]